MDNKVTKQVLLSVMFVAFMFITVIGITYATFMYSESGKVDNIIKTGNIYLKYNEPTNGISLTEAYPMNDETGKLLSGKGEVFNFNVVSTISKSANVEYEVLLDEKLTGALEEENVKVYLASVGSAESSVKDEFVLLEPKYLSELEESTYRPGSKVLCKITPKEGENITTNYRFKMWIADKDANGLPVTLEDISESSSLSVKVSIYGYAK